MLSRIQLYGFKSFARKTELEVNDRIVAVVGPNGSGKSNIVESIRFAMGEQSIKSIRGASAKDLIWHGSKKISKTNRASVKLFFNNKDKIFDFDFSEVIVERVVYLDGESEYFINDSKVRLKDIQTLLASGNVGLSKHTIISQGEADKLVLSSVEQRLEILEDSLGLRSYYIKKQDTISRLKRTQNYLNEVSLAQSELKPRLIFLQKQIEKKNKLDILKTKMISLFEDFVSSVKYEIEKNKAKIKERNEVQSRINSIKSQIKELESEKEEIINTQYENIDKKLKDIDINISELENQKLEILKLITKLQVNKRDNFSKIDDKKLSSILKNLSIEAKSAMKSYDIERITNTLEHIAKELENLSEILIQDKGAESVDIESLEKIKKLQNDLNAKEKEIKNMLDEKYRLLSSQNKKDKINEISLKIANKNLELKELESKYQSILYTEHKINELENSIKEHTKELLILAPELGKDIQRALNTEQKDVKNPKKELEKVKLQIENIGVIDESVIKEYEDVKSRYDFYNNEINDIKQTIKTLQDLISSLDEKIKSKFSNGVDSINKKFSEFINILFNGGSGELVPVLIKKGDIKKRGVDIKIKLPKKSVTRLNMLSGGERSLVSIALVFAMSQVSPPPFLVLDETDAALDELNASRYANMLKILSKSTQLIIITHNRETMSVADTIYGVVMGEDGSSKIIKVNFDEAKDMVN